MLRYVENRDVIILLLVVAVGLIAISRMVFPTLFQEFISLPVNDKFTRLREKEISIVHPFQLLLYLVHMITLGMACTYFYITWQESGGFDWSFFGQFCAIYIVIVAGKVFIEKILASLFKLSDLIDLWHFNKLTWRNYLTIILYFIVLVVVFQREFTLNGWWFILLAGLAINVIVNIRLYWRYRAMLGASLFYFLLYLCALEIAPYLVLYKVVTSV